MPAEPTERAASRETLRPGRSLTARLRRKGCSALTAGFSLLAPLSGCQNDMGVLCAVNVRAAERALGQARASLARSHYEVARRSCPEANLRPLARQISRVERVSAVLPLPSTQPRERSPKELLAARVLEAERLGSIVLWAARTWRTPGTAAAPPTCHASGASNAGWCEGLSQQGVTVRYLGSDPEAFRLSASFPPGVALDCALFGPVVRLEHWTDSSGGYRVERAHCRVNKGPFEGLELLVDTGPSLQSLSLFSPDFVERQRDFKRMLDSRGHPPAR